MQSLGGRAYCLFLELPKKGNTKKTARKKVSYVDGRNPAPVDIRNAPAPCWGRPVSQGYMNLALAEWGSIHAKNPHSTQKKKGSHPPCKVS